MAGKFVLSTVRLPFKNALLLTCNFLTGSLIEKYQSTLSEFDSVLHINVPWTIEIGRLRENYITKCIIKINYIANTKQNQAYALCFAKEE